MQVQAQLIQFSFRQYLIKHECSIIFLIKILTRSNVYTNVRFSYKRVRHSKFEFINSRRLVKRKTRLPSPFYCSPHPFKVIYHYTNPFRLLWPLPFIVFILKYTPPAYYTPPPPSIWHIRVEKRKIYDVMNWNTNNYNTHVAKYLKR